MHADTAIRTGPTATCGQWTCSTSSTHCAIWDAPLTYSDTAREVARSPTQPSLHPSASSSWSTSTASDRPTKRASRDRANPLDVLSAWQSNSATSDALVERRGQQNPRLALDDRWLRYFVYQAARECEDGWRWKADPNFGSGGFGPFKAAWIGPDWKHLQSPLLAVIGGIQDSWGPIPEETLAPRLAHVPELERATVVNAGHFIHMERPTETARLIIDFVSA